MYCSIGFNNVIQSAIVLFIVVRLCVQFLAAGLQESWNILPGISGFMIVLDVWFFEGEQLRIEIVLV